MTLRGADWYRTEAARLRDKAAAVNRDTALQNSYLALALEYDLIADTLEKRSSRAWRLGRSA
jgi:hypothetical protein